MQKLRTVAQVLDWFRSSEIREFRPQPAAERERLHRLFRADYGDELVDECCAAQLVEFLGRQKGCTSNNTRKRIRATICRPFNAATEIGLIARNPFQGVKIQRGRRGRVWAPWEWQAALRASRPYFRRLLVFLRFSGARPGEARGLQFPQVRADIGVIIQEVHKTSWKTDDPRRIHFNIVTLKLLAWLIRHRVKGGHAFVNAEGRPWTMGSLTKYMRSIRKRANLPNDCKLHGLRHTFATSALMLGVDLKTVADLLGHATTRATEIYQHGIDERDWMNRAANRAIGRDDVN